MNVYKSLDCVEKYKAIITRTNILKEKFKGTIKTHQSPKNAGPMFKVPTNDWTK